MPIVSDYTAILSGYSWAGVTSPTNSPAFVTYSFDSAVASYVSTSNFTQEFLDSFAIFSEAEKTAARGALAQWADASGLVFLEVEAGQGDIRFGSYEFSNDPNTAGFAGYGFYAFSYVDEYFAYRDALGGDVFFDHGTASDPFLLLHEIGHALGFKHPFEGEVTLPQALDNHANTVMSYMGSAPGVLGVFDLQAVAAVYGPAGSDGSQVASWSWDALNTVLAQEGFATDDVIFGVSVTDIINGNAGNDRLGGFQGNDQLSDGHGNDSVFGGDGHDLLYATGTLDNDWFDGGEGIDQLSYAGASGGVIVDLVGQFAFGSQVGTDGVLAIENVIGTSGNDVMSGNALSNRFIGGNGLDTLNGAQGADNLQGGGGADTLNGDSGVDSLLGGLGDDTLNGGGDGDTLRGEGGVDTLNGGAGVDNLFGGSGNDILNGGTGNDVLEGQGNNDTLHGNEDDDTIRGAEGADILFGDAGNDSLNAGAGADTLDGGTGNDTLTGTVDGNRDTFVFAVDYDLDRINGYEQGVDRLTLDDALWLDTHPGGLSAQLVINTFGTLNGPGTLLTLDFGNGDILEVLWGGGINLATLGADVLVI